MHPRGDGDLRQRQRQTPKREAAEADAVHLDQQERTVESGTSREGSNPQQNVSLHDEQVDAETGKVGQDSAQPAHVAHGLKKGTSTSSQTTSIAN